MSSLAVPGIRMPQPMADQFHHGAMRSLLWKDFRLASSLLIAAIVGTIAMFMSVAIVGVMNSARGTNADGLVAIWFLMPNLVALGLPPMLIGGENDERSLDWLRTLPLDWRKTLASKWVVAIGVWLFMIAFTSMVMLMVGGSSLLAEWRESSNPIGFAPAIALTSLGYGFSVLAIGFVASTLVRSPVVAVLLVLPLTIAFFACFTLVAEHWRGSDSLVALWALWMPFILLILGLSTFFARRRLAGACDEPWTLPGRARLATSSQGIANVAYQRQPSAIGSLLWQSARQNRVMLIAAPVVAVALIIMATSSVLALLAVIGVGTLQVAMGSMTFQDDSHPAHVGFFAQRGISRTAVWWTRFAPLWVGSFMILLISSIIMPLKLGGVVWLETAVICAFGQAILFAIGVAACLWTRRRSLAFFVAAALASVWSSAVFPFLVRFPDYGCALIVPLAIWWFATWRMMPFWMEGRYERAVTGRWVAYALLSLGAFFAVVFGQRYASMPPDQPAWRARLMAVDLMTESIEGSSRPQCRIMLRDLRSVPDLSPQGFAAPDELRRRLELEWTQSDPDPMASTRELAAVLRSTRFRPGEPSPSSSSSREGLWNLAMNVALMRSNLVRQDIVNGHGDLRELLAVAEPTERLAVIALSRYAFESPDDLARRSIDRETLDQWIQRLPPDSLRRQSRRIATIRSWQALQRQLDDRERVWTRGDERYGVGSLAPGQLTLSGFERRRTRAQLDIATRWTLDVLESGQFPKYGSDAFHQWTDHWARATSLRNSPRRPAMVSIEQVDDFPLAWKDWPVFIAEHELAIDALRRAGKATAKHQINQDHPDHHHPAK